MHRGAIHMLKTMMLATFGRQRLPRLLPQVDHDWARAWASRWWIVEAADVGAARSLIRRTEVGAAPGLSPSIEGRIVTCGRNCRGGPGFESAPSQRARRAPTHA